MSGRLTTDANGLHEGRAFSPCSNTRDSGRRRVCEALNRANASLPFGRFELDMKDGRLRFVSSIPLHDCSVGTEAVELLAFVGVSEFDEYLPAFLAVSAGTLPPGGVA